MNAESKVGRAARMRETAIRLFLFAIRQAFKRSNWLRKPALYDDVQYTRLPWTQEYVELAS